MNKLLAMLLALLMALTVCVGALAEEASVDAEATPDIEALEDVDEWLYDEDEEEWEWDDEEELDVFDDIIDEDDVWLDEEDTVEDVLMSAMEVYSWFVLYPLDIDYDKPNEAGDRYQVLDERFNTMQALRDFAGTYFCDAIVEDLFEMNIYQEENGYLYATDEGRQIDEHIGETEFAVTEETAEKVVYTVTVTYWEDAENEGANEPEEEVFTYVRELIDGEWKFAQFPFFW